VIAERYLQRIGYRGSTAPTHETLVALERAHMLAVPFENLDIHRGRRLVLDRGANFAKIVERRRGGWCYELNGMFSWLLESLGYDVTLIGSRVEWDGGHSRDLAHVLMLVQLDQTYLVDVGFGYGSVGVVPLAQAAGGVIPHADGLRVVFSQEPRELADFTEMCEFQQTSPGSNFVRTRVCSKALPGGYLRLRELVLTESHGDEETTRELSGEDEWQDVLRERFGVELEPGRG
jgi:N-hydroxyarylamine O-acetyltransferase